VPYDPVHALRNTEEVDEECPGHPNPVVMEQGLPFDDPLDAEGVVDEEEDEEQDDLDVEERADDGADLEACAGLDELSYGVNEAGEVGLIHLVRSSKVGVLEADEVYMGQ
jgi:hypothetical protein